MKGDATNNPTRLIMRSYLCERCQAAPQQPCLTESGAISQMEHAARYRAALEDSRLPLYPTTPDRR